MEHVFRDLAVAEQLGQVTQDGRPVRFVKKAGPVKALSGKTKLTVPCQTGGSAGWDQHTVDNVDQAVGGANVGLDDPSVVDVGVTAADMEVNPGAPEGLGERST